MGRGPIIFQSTLLLTSTISLSVLGLLAWVSPETCVAGGLVLRGKPASSFFVFLFLAVTLCRGVSLTLLSTRYLTRNRYRCHPRPFYDPPDRVILNLAFRVFFFVVSSTTPSQFVWVPQLYTRCLFPTSRKQLVVMIPRSVCSRSLGWLNDYSSSCAPAISALGTL